jgi:hypothetical protein
MAVVEQVTRKQRQSVAQQADLDVTPARHQSEVRT